MKKNLHEMPVRPLLLLKKSISLIVLLLFVAIKLSATVTTVSSIAALQAAINNAAAGDIIILANGVYTTTADITINKKGTAAQPITITAQTIGGAEITGKGGFSLESPAAYIVIKGFKLTHTSSKTRTNNGTTFCRFTRNIFQTTGDGEYLLLSGSDHQVDYNTFQHKDAMGRFIAVRGSGSQIAQRLWIHHNYFNDFKPQTGNGAETLQFGLSGFSLSSSNSIVEYNLFEQCAGENELISVKASAVTLRYNTIRNCPAQFTLRHGNKCQVYGNYFVNTPGLRIFGDDHVIYSNHFENCNPAINIGNGDGEVADGAALTSHDRPDRVLIAYNTIVNPAGYGNYTQSGRTGGLGATYTTFVNNIIQGGNTAASISGPYTNATWAGNITYNTTGPGAMPAGTFTVVNPLLAKDATGTYHLQTGSPAIGAGTGSYPSVTTDMDGQPRNAPLDAGADQVSVAPVTARILNPADVGHAAITDKPQVGINTPADKTITDAGTVLTIVADAISPDDTISRVDFFFDSSKIGEALSKPYTINWTAVEGTHTLSAKAIDSKGKESDPAIVVVTVNPSGTRVKITAPAAGSTFTAPAAIPVTADASDSLGTVVNVEFYNGATKIGQDTVAPYSFNWNNVAAGKYALQAKVTTSLGKTALSQPVSITVNASTTSFDITDNGGTITAQYPNTTKPTEDVPSLIDNNKSTKYYRSGRTALWVQYKSTVPAIVVKYTISSANDVPARDPKDWTLQGSNNGTSWTTLDTRSGETFASRLLTKTYTANNTNAYLYYRLNITANNGETGTQFSEWELFERRLQTITLDSIGTKTYGDDEIELNAQSDAQLPVTIEVVSGPATYADGTLSITGAGVVTIKASQAGNDNYFPASAEETFVVNKAPQSIVFDSIGTKVYGDAPFALNASVESELPVTFSILAGSATLDNNILTIIGTGDVTIKALQAGNENYIADSALQSFTVIKAAQHIVFAAVGDKAYGQDSIVKLNASTASGLPVSFVATGPVVLNGDSLRITGAGNVTVTALQNGNENYEADTVQQTFTVKKALQVITFPTVAPKLKIETATLNATASTGLPVTYTVVSGGATVYNNNQLKFTTEGLVVVKAMQAGNNNYDTASAEQTILVLGIGSLKEGVDIKIYPNPTPGPLKITLQHKKDRNYSFILFDKTGRQVATANILQGQTTAEVNFNLGGLRNDLYFLNVTDGVDKTVRIIVKY